MNPEERAALERLLEYVGRGFCAVQDECRMLRQYLADLPAPPPVPTTTEQFIAQTKQLSSLVAAHLGSLKELPIDKDAVINDLRQQLIQIERAKAIRAANRLAAKKRAEKAKTPTKKPIAKTRTR
jgi:hypothetical protein